MHCRGQRQAWAVHSVRTRCTANTYTAPPLPKHTSNPSFTGAGAEREVAVQAALDQAPPHPVQPAPQTALKATELHTRQLEPSRAGSDPQQQQQKLQAAPCSPLWPLRDPGTAATAAQRRATRRSALAAPIATQALLTWTRTRAWTRGRAAPRTAACMERMQARWRRTACMG